MVTDTTECVSRLYWHIWLFISENDDRFFYGYAAPSYHLPPSSPHKSSTGHDSIVEYYTGLGIDDFAPFQEELSNGIFSTELFGENIPNCNMDIQFHQRSIQNTLGCTAVLVDSYYSMSLEEYDVSQEGIKRMLGHLGSAKAFNEPDRFIHRLGAFDVINMPEHAEEDQCIVNFRLPKRQDTSMRPIDRNAYEIWRREDFAQSRHWAHVCLFSGNTPVNDAFHILEPRMPVFGPITINEIFDRAEFRLFDDKGLLHHEDSIWMNQFSTTVSIGQRSVKYNSPLTDRGRGSGDAEVAEALTNVSIRSWDRASVMNVATGHEFRDYCQEMRERGKTLFQAPSPDRWFSKGVAGSLETLRHVKTLLEGQGVAKAWIADPFFDAKASENLIPRIGVRNLELVIIANLRDVDACREDNEVNPVINLENRLDSLRQIIHCNLKVKNLRTAPNSNEQVFHDRYLCLQKQKDKVSVYLLSNSFNAYAENYPFCLSQLGGFAAQKVYEYILSLEGLKNPVTGADLHCDLDWSK